MDKKLGFQNFGHMMGAKIPTLQPKVATSMPVFILCGSELGSQETAAGLRVLIDLDPLLEEFPTAIHNCLGSRLNLESPLCARNLCETICTYFGAATASCPSL